MARAMLVWFAAGANAIVLKQSAVEAPQSKQCVVWHSQHKSAGQRVENYLSMHVMTNHHVTPEAWRKCGHDCHFICDSETWNCEKQSCVRKDWYKPFGGYQMAMRGYVQTLQGTPEWGRAKDGRCVWATMSREPISRLVSAYLYCKNTWPRDPLCGARRMLASEGTLHDFARHWGNYLFREFLWFPELRALAESRPDFNRNFTCAVEMWVQFKDQLNGGDDIQTASGMANFEAVKTRLLGLDDTQPLYDAFGVLEEWEDTMLLFDHVMPIQYGSWVHDLGASKKGTHNSWKYEDEQHKMLEDAMNDSVLKQIIAADLELYHDIIVPKFKEAVTKIKNAQ